MNSDWHRVSRREPCPICHHPDWCMVSNDGNVAICQRVESDRPTKNSGGWIHRLRPYTGSRPSVERRPYHARPYAGRDGVPSPSAAVGGTTAYHARPYAGRDGVPSPSAAVGGTTALPSFDMAAYFARLPTEENDLQRRMCGYLERELGLPAPILLTLDWRWDRNARAVAIPMRDAEGVVTGIRYRELRTGAKWAKRGSVDGLFFDPEFIPYDVDELLVCEGPTDLAAAMACGFWCVGRSSCGTGRDLIRAFARTRHIRRVTIVADDDRPKPRPGGGTWRPGYDGAVRLAEGLGLPYRIVLPPLGMKDLREWYRAGTLNEESLHRAIQGADWKGPANGGNR